MGDSWKAADDVYEIMKGLVASNHPDLALVVDEIIIVFNEKARKSGGNTVYGNAGRVGKMTNVIGGTDYKFILTLGADTWETELSSRQRKALLDHLLCMCRCDEDPSSGELKCYNVRPDIMAFRENVERYGMWFPKEHETDDNAESNQVVQEAV
jgi:hypothetical protein